MRSPQPEADYLRRLVLAAARGRDVAPAPRGVDWEKLERLIRLHRVAPLVDGVLSASAGVNASTAHTVADAARRLRLRGGLLRLELARVVTALDAESCAPIVLKGAALAVTLYDDPGRRVFSDIDVLVPRDRVEHATRAVRALGYAPAGSDRETALWDRYHFHRVLVGPWGARLELHWDLTRPGSFMRFDLEGFRSRARSVEADGARMRVPDDGDHLLHGASQAVKEGFCDLRRAVDTALLVDRGAALRDGLAERARAYGLASALWLQMEIAREILEVAPPVEVAEAIAPRPLRRRCMASLDPALRALEAYAERRSGYRHLLRWLCSPGPRATARSVGSYLVPGVEEALADAEADGFVPDAASRAVTTVRRAASLTRILGWQAWRLVRGRTHREPSQRH